MRKLIIALFAGALVAAIIQVIRTMKAKWTGLSEAEVRARLDERFGDKIPDEKPEIVDGIVKAMRDRGMIVDEPAEGATAEEASESGETGGDAEPTEVVVDATADETEDSAVTP